MTTATGEREGSHSLEDLIWEHDQANAGLRKLFELYKAHEQKAEQSRYNVVSSRIIDNLVINLNRINCLPQHIYIEDFEMSLKLLLVFKKADYDKNAKNIFLTIQAVQSLAIEKDGKDFRWSITTTEGFEPCLPLEEFHRSLSLKAQ